MDRFHPKTDKGKPLTHVVSFHGRVPLERGLCYALYLVDKHYPFSVENVLSASRSLSHIKAHNQQYGTNLHSQAWLIEAHLRDPVHFAPANPLNMTSHCLFSDGNAAYKTAAGRSIPPRGKLPWYSRGIDLLNGDFARLFCRRADSLGLHFVQPYHSSSEAHHVVCVQSPLKVLADRHVIHKR
jgi:hypothetical protein